MFFPSFLRRLALSLTTRARALTALGRAIAEIWDLEALTVLLGRLVGH